MSDDIQTWIDTSAIQHAIVRYSDAATRGAWDDFEALWMPDAVWEVAPPVGTKVVGAAAIRATCEETMGQQEFLLQMTHGSAVRLFGDGTASATTTIHALARRPGHHHFMNFAVYYDDLVKHEGAWRFQRRLLQPIYVESEPLSGQVAISRAELR